MTIQAPPGRRAIRESGGRRVIRALGILMVAVGLGFIGYFAWQYWGTNYVAKQKQDEIRAVIVKDWDKGIDGNAIGLLRVPRFGDDYEVPINKGGDLIGSKGRKALAEGVARYEPGAKPGEIGNFAVAGHRVTHGEPFRDFLKLKEGDKVFVETRRKVYTYVLRNDGDAITVDFTVGWPLADVPDPKIQGEEATEPVLTMLTCSELFHTDDRSIVVGDLESIEDKASGKVTES
ncbi:sortase domain-containing protein [Aeromicrobium sp.]|uniref:sortase domain-containing protein n=1 Tax=Aeromicrobium sp. TaxID=1871063 RepID=UPI003D6BA21F